MEQRHVVVTGGARGIGDTILRTFVASGAVGHSLDAMEPENLISGVNYLTGDVG